MPHKNLFSKQGVTNIKFDTNEYSNIYLNKKQSQRISEYICIKKWYKRISGLWQARPLVWLQASEFQGPWFTSEALVWLLVHYSTFCYLGMVQTENCTFIPAPYNPPILSQMQGVPHGDEKAIISTGKKKPLVKHFQSKFEKESYFKFKLRAQQPGSVVPLVIVHGVTNIKFWYKQIFEYIYIKKIWTNEYPNIFV